MSSSFGVVALEWPLFGRKCTYTWIVFLAMLMLLELQCGGEGREERRH